MRYAAPGRDHIEGCTYPASETPGPGPGEGYLRGEVELRIERHFGHDEGAACGPLCGTTYDGPMPPLDPPHHCAAVEQRTLAEQKVARVEALLGRGHFVDEARIRAALADPEADRGGTT